MADDRNQRDEKLEQILYLVKQEHRNQPLDFYSTIEQIYERGTTLTPRELSDIAQRFGERHTIPPEPPRWLVNFIAQYAKQNGVRSVLDPAAGLGGLLIGLAETLKPNSAHGIISRAQDHMVMSGIETRHPIDWVVGDHFDVLGQVTNNYDLVVSMPPLGVDNAQQEFSSMDGQTIRVRDSRSYLLLLQACLNLSQNGLGIFIVANNFFFGQDRNTSVYRNLEQFGLYLDSVLTLPPGLLAPYTSIPTNLVVIKRQRSEQLFIAELSDNKNRNKGVLSLLQQHKAAEVFEMGTLVPRETFRSYQASKQEARIQRLAEQYGFPPVSIADVVTEANLGGRDESFEFEPKQNAVYFPLIGDRPVVITMAEMTGKPSSYLQLVLDSKQVIASYFVLFFNTELGQAIRSSMQGGFANPRANKKSVLEAQIYFPSPEDQAKIVEVDNQFGAALRNLVEDQDDFRASFIVTDEYVARLEEKIGSLIEQQERFEVWLDTLPFPLSAILWGYHATNDDFKKYRLLLRFFEATAQFFAVVLLSGVVSNPVLRKNNQKFLLSVKNWDNASFGVWKHITNYLIAQIHKAGLEEQVAFASAFATPFETLTKVFPSEITTVLDETNELRNQWRGHGGIDDQVAAKRLPELVDHLNRVREVLARHWRDFRLIKPEQAKLQSNEVYQTVQVLNGHHNPFRREELRLVSILKANRLYIHTRGENKAMAVQPLLQVFEQLVGENASYFYSKLLKSEKVVFISHHFEREPEVEKFFQETFNALNKIFESGKNKNAD